MRSKLLITYRQRRKEVNYDTVNRYWSRYCSFDRYRSRYWYWFSYIQSSAIARQPEAEPKIKVNLVLGCALAEATAIYGFVIALLIILMLH